MKEPLFKISYRLRNMKPPEQCAYLIACINLEGVDTQRRRELNKALIDARTQQIRQEVKTKRIASREHA